MYIRDDFPLSHFFVLFRMRIGVLSTEKKKVVVLVDDQAFESSFFLLAYPFRFFLYFFF